MPAARAPSPEADPDMRPSDVIRGLVLAANGVTEDEATLLMIVLRRLDEIEAENGPAAAYAAARHVRKAWLRQRESLAL